MAETTGIEWCDHTWSPWEGCTKISPACDHCYAEARNQRFAKGANWGPGAPRRRTVDWTKPLLWNKRAEKDGTRPRVFPSLCDPFDNEVPADWRLDFFALIANTPHLDWLILTKRIGNVSNMVNMSPCFWQNQLSNVWLGATICNQEEADRDIPKLLGVPARVRFVSIEPMLGQIDIRRYMWPVHPRWPARYKSPAEALADGAEVTYHRQCLLGAHVPLINWVIAGGESGPKARPSHPDWFRSLRDQCKAAGVPFLFKQWGEWAPAERTPDRDARITMPGQCRDLWAWPDGTRDGWRTGPISERIGKPAAGRLLDGVQHDGFPL